MCSKSVDNSPHALEFVSKYFKTQTKKDCDKAVTTYPSTIKFLPECFMTYEKCRKVVNIYFFYLIIFLIGIKLKKYVTELLLKILVSIYTALINI